MRHLRQGPRARLHSRLLSAPLCAAPHLNTCTHTPLPPPGHRHLTTTNTHRPAAVFDVDDDQARAAALGMEVNGFSFEGMDAPGMDYALNR